MRFKRTAKAARVNALGHLGMAAIDITFAVISNELDPDAGESALVKIKEAVEALTPKRG